MTEQRRWKVGIASQSIPGEKHNGLLRFDVELWGKRPPDFESELVQVQPVADQAERDDTKQVSKDHRGQAEGRIAELEAAANRLIDSRVGGNRYQHRLGETLVSTDAFDALITALGRWSLSTEGSEE